LTIEEEAVTRLRDPRNRIARDVGRGRRQRRARGVEEGDEIPEALFEAVAEILRVVRGLEPIREEAPSSVQGKATETTPG
jgi:hypothetical protein